MEISARGMSKTLVASVLILVIIVAVVGAYAALTYPRKVLSFSVSFSVGADVERKEFDVPILDQRVQVKVVINSGTSLWTARILSQENVLWSHGALQGGQTTYESEWIELQNGHYNFTFATAGLGSLNADIEVTSKGGFW
jgi:hypothetical protein